MQVDDEVDEVELPPAGNHGIPPPPAPAFIELGPPTTLYALSLVWVWVSWQGARHRAARVCACGAARWARGVRAVRC